MKISINISNCTEFIDVFIDGIKAEKKTYSQVGFVFEVDSGTHTVEIIKKPEALERKWWKLFAVEWMNLLSGDSDIKKIGKSYSSKTFSVKLAVRVNQDITLDLKLCEKGFILVGQSEDAEVVSRSSQTDESAKKRIKRICIIPILLIELFIELGFIIVSAVLFREKLFIRAFVMLALVLLGAWFIRFTIYSVKNEK